ncbi:hypothetical protein APF79_03345 [bacterium BRH_c32]|nr:MAG: hypothetical protein APF79_03345 [bacterium BRH_c32]
MKLPTLFIRICFGIIFIVSGFLKLIDLKSFSLAVKDFNLVPDVLILPIVYILPSIEICFGFFIIFKYKYYFSLVSISILLYIFCAAIILKLLNHEELLCGCFGNYFDNKISSFTLYRNILFILICYYLIIYENLSKSNRPILYFNNILKSVKIPTFYSFIAFFIIIEMSLFIQNRELKMQINELTKNELILNKGDHAIPFSYYGKNNFISDIHFTTPHTLIFIFFTSCVSCINNLKIWNEVYLEYKSDDINILGITTDSLKKLNLLKKNTQVLFPSYSSDDSTFIKIYKTQFVPQTLLINSSGIIEKSYIGTLNLYQLYSLKKRLNFIDREEL